MALKIQNARIFYYKTQNDLTEQSSFSCAAVIQKREYFFRFPWYKREFYPQWRIRLKIQKNNSRLWYLLNYYIQKCMSYIFEQKSHPTNAWLRDSHVWTIIFGQPLCGQIQYWIRLFENPDWTSMFLNNPFVGNSNLEFGSLKILFALASSTTLLRMCFYSTRNACFYSTHCLFGALTLLSVTWVCPLDFFIFAAKESRKTFNSLLIWIPNEFEFPSPDNFSNAKDMSMRYYAKKIDFQSIARRTKNSTKNTKRETQIAN